MCCSVVTAIVGHTHYLLFIIARRCHRLQVVVVAVVHGHNEVKLSKHRLLETLRAMFEQIATCSGGTTHATVGQFSGMTAVCTRRVEMETMFEIVFAHDVTHNAFGSRRTTYIAQTDKEYFISSVIFHNAKLSLFTTHYIILHKIFSTFAL